MTISIKIKKGQIPTEEQIQEVNAAAMKTPVYDEDAPKYSIEQLQRYHKAALKRQCKTPIALYLSENTIQKAL